MDALALQKMFEFQRTIFSMKKQLQEPNTKKMHSCSDRIVAGHNEDRGTSWVVILGWLS